MLALTEDQKKQLRNDTKEAAASLLDDLEHIRSVVAKTNPSRTEIKLLSVTLRRHLIIDRDLQKIAAARIGKILLKVPDNNPAVKLSKQEQLPFFLSGGANLIGVYHRAATVQVGNKPNIPEFDPLRMAQVRVDNFLSQPVICLNSQWASRADVIQYIANYGSTAHTNAPDSERTKLIHKARSVWNAVASGTDTVAMSVDFDKLLSSTTDELDTQFISSPGFVDAALAEILVASHHLADSEEILALETLLRDELGWNPGPPRPA